MGSSQFAYHSNSPRFPQPPSDVPLRWRVLYQTYFPDGNRDKRLKVTRRSLSLVGALVLGWTGGQSPAHSTAGQGERIDPEKELTVRDLSVIDDPTRSLDPCVASEEPLPAWSFGRIMRSVSQQAGESDASAFVKDWLDTWTQEQVVNGHLLRPVGIDQIVTVPWLAASGGERLDLGRAPFRLLAIVNRLDLNEFRMEYVATDFFCEPMHFWVIFEFELPTASIQDLRALAEAWHALGILPFGEEYNAALQSITDQLISAPLKHVNTVEEEASIDEWNYRSFAIAGQSLVNVPLFQSPDVRDDRSPELISWVNDNQDDILADRHIVPVGLLGGDTRNLDWTGTGFQDPLEVRHHFALATCNGCHAGETATDFVHINRRRRGEQSMMSEYLTGETILDPGGETRTFNELARRADFLRDLLQGPMFRVPAPSPSW